MDSISSQKSYKKSESKKTIQKKHLQKYKVIYNNEDVTPKFFNNRSGIFQREKFLKLKSKPELRDPFDQYSSLMTSMMFQTLIQSEAAQSHESSDGRSLQSMIRSDDKLENQLNNLTSLRSCHYSEYFDPLSLSDRLNLIENLEQVRIKLNSESSIKLKLTETPVNYLFEWTSETVDVNDEEANDVVKRNAHYEYITEGKGRNRKTTNVEIQTLTKIFKTRSTEKSHKTQVNRSVFVTLWDMYDTFNEQSETPQEDWEKKNKNLNKADQMLELMKNKRFQYSVLIMQRILAHHTFVEPQKYFRNFYKTDPFNSKIKYKYSLKLLWTFESAITTEHSVTSMEWNPRNNDILAVGYGRFFYSDNKTGVLRVWNIKNPKQPEREYYFTASISAVAFSILEPNLLAVGFHDGSLKILDISYKDLKVLYGTDKLDSPFRDPIWKITWMNPDEIHPNEEHLVCCSQGGRISRFRRSKINELTHFPMMRVTINDSQSKGIDRIKQCCISPVPVNKYIPALVITKNPVDNDVYYIGTGDGSVHICSRNFLHQHMDVFTAHNGPVYAINFSIYCNKLFLTCGADSNINLWVNGISEPIETLNLTSLEYIQDAMWCPSHSTILASIAGNKIYLWDILRKTYQPTSIHETPNNSRLSTLLFTPCGHSLAVGDVAGKVHIYSLQNMPFPPFYQTEMLTQIINKILVTRQDLKNKIQSTGGLNWSKNHKLQF